MDDWLTTVANGSVSDQKLDMKKLRELLDKLPKASPDVLWPEFIDPFKIRYNQLTRGLPVYFSEYACNTPLFIPDIGVIAKSKEDVEKFLNEVYRDSAGTPDQV